MRENYGQGRQEAQQVEIVGLPGALSGSRAPAAFYRRACGIARNRGIEGLWSCGDRSMRAPVHAFAQWFGTLWLGPLCGLVCLAGCVGTARVEGFTATGPASFLYSAHSNTVMTENDDGVAEKLRRRWIADALQAHAMCNEGYIVDTRSFIPNADGPWGNGGEVLYKGRCLGVVTPPPPPVVEKKREEKTVEQNVES